MAIKFLKKVTIAHIIALSIGAIAFLFWLIYLKSSPENAPKYASYLPAFNAGFNTLSTICLIGGLIAIKKGEKSLHQYAMMSAFIFSTLFLITYVIYHSIHGDVSLTKTGWIRPVYFFILISHVCLTTVGLPLILSTFLFAFKKEFTLHKKWARITFPIWLYISVTGILIYAILHH